MDESEENMSAEDTQNVDSPVSVKIKPKKRSLVERELETNLTARVTSPATSEGSNTSRYGRARKLKTAADMIPVNMIDAEKVMKPLKIDVSKQPQAYKMHASNSPISKESPRRTISVGSSIEDQIENIYNENIALSRFGSEEKAKSQSPAKKFSKVYIRKDLIQKPDTDTVVLIKNMFSPTKPNSHLNNILERSSEKYALNGHGKPWNCFPDTPSVVKTLDFDGKKKKKEDDKKKEKVVSKNELFELEASCEYQVGDLAWARVGTYPFWPCIVTREPLSDMFVKKKLFGRVERSVIHVTFFGDNGRRGWIVDNMLRKYHGRAEFQTSRDKFTPEAKKKDPRLYAAHFVSEKKLPLWNVSVDEAETLMKEPKRLRIDILYDMLEKARSSKTTPKREKGGKISRTDSDVSLSESLYDTLFSEDDGKTDENSRSKRARNKSLDVSEVVTACLDNMAAKSGIIQIQRQSHMDRWLQKAKSKTPEKIQPKLHIKGEREKRKDKAKNKTKEGKKSHKARKNESLGSDANLLPYQNEHDYSSVNYENHDINDSSNKNTDSASGHDSTLNSSDIGVVVKIENLSTMEDLSQGDIITTVVDDDIIMTDPENISNDDGRNDINHNDDNNSIINETVENNNEPTSHLPSNNPNENEKIASKEETPANNSDLTNSTQPRRSKRKRQTFEGLNNGINENKAKEPKLDLTESEPNVNNTSNTIFTPENNAFPVNTVKSNEDCVTTKKTEVECSEPNISKPEIETTQYSKPKSIRMITTNSSSKPVVVIEPLDLNGLKGQLIIKGSKQLVRHKSLDGVIKNYKAKDRLGTLDVVQNNVTSDDLKATDTIKNTSQDSSAAEGSHQNEKTKTDSAIEIPTSDVSQETQVDVFKNGHKRAEEDSNDSGRKEVDNCATPVMVEEEKSIIDPDSKTNSDPNVSLETSVVPTKPSLQKTEEILGKNKATNVVIGEETYIFDRTLSQDYGEIDAGENDEVSSIPGSSNTEDKDTNIMQSASNGQEETPSQDNKKASDMENIEHNGRKCENDEVSSIPGSSNTEDKDTNIIQSASNGQEETPSQDNKKASDMENIEHNGRKCDPTSAEAIVSSKVDDLSTNDGYGAVGEKPASDDNISNISEATSDLRHVSIFLDKRDIKANSTTETIEDNKITSPTSEVSNIINDEQNEVSNNQVNEENNAKCVFLDQNLLITNAQSAESIEIKRKSTRFRLNRTRHIKVANAANNLQTPTSSEKKMNTDIDKCVLETASTNSINSETTITRRTGRTKDKLDPENRLNDPEFIKYLEIRQDALLDEQPDLTQEEIVTYLYQNWLYEEGNKSEIKKIDDNEQSNLVKGSNQEPAPQPKKIKKKPKVEIAPELKNIDIRDMMQKAKRKSVSDESKSQSKPSVNGIEEPNKHDIPNHIETPCEIVKITQKFEDTQSISVNKLNDIEETKLSAISKTIIDNSNRPKENNVLLQSTAYIDDIDIHTEPKSDAGGKDTKLCGIEDAVQSESAIIHAEESLKENGSRKLEKNIKDESDFTESVALKKAKSIKHEESHETSTGKLEIGENNEHKDFNETKINGILENEEVNSKSTDAFDPETASIKSEDSGVSVTTRKGRKEKHDAKKSMEDPEFLKYLEARQDALIDEQPDLTQEEIVTYLYQTWFYEESQKSDVKKSDETEQSNLVKGLNQEPVPQPRKYKKKPKLEKETKAEKESKVDKDPVAKVLKNADIRDMVQKPKRKATQSKPYYNEEFSDLEEEDLETFKIFDRNEQEGEEIDEVELYFEQLTKPKPNVFKGYVRERVCEICDRTGNLVKCKSCHGTFHVDCGKKEAEVIEVAAPTRGRKKKRGRRPKNYDPLMDSGSQSDERSQDANNSEEFNISIEDEAESHIVIDADNFETQWENKLKELQTESQDDYASDQEINWEVKPGHCEVVDLKHKEKPIDHSDYKCNNCLKYDTPVCFVCKSNKSPKAQTEIRQKCQVAHCHRYYHLECLDHWPQTQFNSWEPSKTNKKSMEYIEALSCPRHVCHTCVSDDPRGCKTRFCGDKLARCVKCPATYHSYTKCLPAGTQILTGSQIICPRHYEHRPGKVPCHVNTGWCFICALGGTLICCEYCPTSFHAECLNIKPPEGSYMCEDCETGRLPLYGEMVWVKLGHYRWWPGIVLHPTEIPDNIMAVKHSPGEFVVRFFGQYDHYWVNRGRVFPFQEGDSGRISSQKSKIDAAFTTAMEHAQRACEILKKMQPNEEEDLDIASSLLPPHYVKLKVNKPVGGVVRRDMDANSLTQCDCDPTQPDPCGPYSHCLNRMLLTECGPLCRAGDRCNNRAFERRLYPRLQPSRAPHRGWGLRTLDDIKQGQFVIEYVGELIDLDEFRRRMCRKHEIRDENFYFLTLDKERMIDAGPKGNLARFMNHCCEPNCETQKWTVLGDVRVGLFALRDIPANSEVTFNYNLECAGIEKKRCLCGAKRCSGYIGAKPKQLEDDQPKKPKRTYKKRKPVEDTKPKPKIKIKPIKPRELTEIEKDLLIIKSATSGMSSDSENSRASVEEKNSRAVKRKRVSFSTDDGAKRAKVDCEEV